MRSKADALPLAGLEHGIRERFRLCLGIVHGLRNETGGLHQFDGRRFSAVERLNSQRSGPPL